ncbi:hypothetical protein ACFL0H_07940 [Thermodesulfobacteriota bacterium]
MPFEDPAVFNGAAFFDRYHLSGTAIACFADPDIEKIEDDSRQILLQRGDPRRQG